MKLHGNRRADAFVMRLWATFGVIVFALLACTPSLTVEAARMTPIRAYHVFDKDHVDLHKYAAILAAQETQRKIRDTELKKLMNPMYFWLCKMDVRKNFNDPESRLRRGNEKVNDVCEDYERRLIDTVESYGLDAQSFNDLSYEIMNQQELKKQVMLQAFYYKLAADLDHNVVKEVVSSVVDSDNNNKKKNARMHHSLPHTGALDEVIDPASQHEDHVLRFTKALKEVETNRLEMRQDLLDKLGIKKFPRNMCDPEVLPAMAPAIQNAWYVYMSCVFVCMCVHILYSGHSIRPVIYY